MTTIQRSTFLSRFQCLGDACEDTCCKGWGMQLSAATVEKYRAQAPALLDAVTSGEAEHIMRRDPATDYCVKFEAGWCGIHREYGTEFLGDACHFFPRVTRRLGDRAIMTASGSCPEVVRLAVMQPDGLGWDEAQTDRLPDSLRDYLPAGVNAAEALAVHESLVAQAADASVSPQRALARLRSVAASLQVQPVAQWPAATAFYLKSADARLAQPEPQPTDPFHLLHALQGLIAASRPTPRPRLTETLQAIETALQVTLDWERVSIHPTPQSAEAAAMLAHRWQTEWAQAQAPLLRRWLQLQLRVALFPFAGLGDDPLARITLIAVRFATLQLALMAACQGQGGPLPEAQAVRIIQSLARFMDHLADPALSLRIYQETGWLREARLRALIGDA